ncbi:MAG: asparagine synthase [Rhodospirillaceae bacterium]|nr:asparagine synthase [Rhodospirillaceae bacterium]
MAPLTVEISGSIDCLESPAWVRFDHPGVRLWLRGYIEADGARRLAQLLESPGTDLLHEIGGLLAEVTGHFAVIAAARDALLVAVDWVRSIPVFLAQIGDVWHIDDRADRLRKRANLGVGDLDRDAALSLAMAGYTIDRATLYRGLRMLGPGECALLRRGAAPAITRYYTYRPWQVRDDSRSRLKGKLTEATLDVVERMIASLDGRPLAVPLSAGYDSRLIASAAKHLGFKNVLCFAYGRLGNFEAEASRAIAERLGYRWAFAPLSISSQRRFFASETYRLYLEQCDTCASVPFVQDMSAVAALKEHGFIPPDAVIANGNSGDFISGMHIAPQLRNTPDPALGLEARKLRILDALEKKHFALWEALRTPGNRGFIKERLWSSIEAAGGALGDVRGDHGLYEYAEFQDRQCKYVITGQRIYESLGHHWRLPLWDNAYMRFWESVPLEFKVGQSLYSEMLHDADWGGVWNRVPVNRKTIRPRWLIPLRFTAKIACAPLGQKQWHRFERRFLQYWMDVTCNAAVTSYRRVARDGRGARHAVAWLAADYLAEKGVELDRISA